MAAQIGEVTCLISKYWCVQAYTEDVARGILPSWTAIAQRRQAQQFTEEQRNWQLLRWDSCWRHSIIMCFSSLSWYNRSRTPAGQQVVSLWLCISCSFVIPLCLLLAALVRPKVSRGVLCLC
jgi:hypothetical protein